MIRFAAPAASLLMMLGVSTSCFAYECTDSESYRAGLQELKLAREATTAHLSVAVEYLQKHKSLDLNTALRQVMQAGSLSRSRSSTNS